MARRGGGGRARAAAQGRRHRQGAPCSPKALARRRGGRAGRRRRRGPQATARSTQGRPGADGPPRVLRGAWRDLDVARLAQPRPWLRRLRLRARGGGGGGCLGAALPAGGGDSADASRGLEGRVVHCDAGAPPAYARARVRACYAPVLACARACSFAPPCVPTSGERAAAHGALRRTGCARGAAGFRGGRGAQGHAGGGGRGRAPMARAVHLDRARSRRGEGHATRRAQQRARPTE